MKRLALLAAIATALALPCAALASATTFKGHLKGGGRVAFELKRNDRGVRKVDNWRWHDLDVTCDSRPGETFNHAGKANDVLMPVSDQHFHAELYNEKYGNTVTVDGSFPSNWKHARGTLQLVGDTRWGTTCSSSGPVDWTAKKT